MMRTGATNQTNKASGTLIMGTEGMKREDTVNREIEGMRREDTGNRDTEVRAGNRGTKGMIG
jgi:hypothetical protein